MSAEIVNCHGRDYVNTENGLSLVHDFPNPFSPDSALPAINWKGSWIIITPTLPGSAISAPVMPTRTVVASLKREPKSTTFFEVIPDDSSLPSPESPSTDMRIPEEDLGLPISMESEPEIQAENNATLHQAPISPVRVVEVPPLPSIPDNRNNEEIKPITRQMTPQVPRPLSNSEIRMRAPSTRGYTTVQELGEIPRWSEVEERHLAQQHHRSQGSRSAQPQNRNGREASNGRRSAEAEYPSQRNGKRSHYDRDNVPSGRSSSVHADYRPPSPRRPATDSFGEAPDRRFPQYGRESANGNHMNSRLNERNGDRERERTISSPPPIHRAPIPRSNDHHDRASSRNAEEPVAPRSTVASSPVSLSIFPPLPAELTDRSELERYVASNAGPPNVGPTITVWVTREGMPQKDLEVEIATSASVSGLKAKLRAITGMPIREQRLSLGKTTLHPDHKMSSLQEEINLGATIQLIKRGGEGRIEVETVDGRIHAFEMGPKDFVADLEDAVIEKVFPNADRVRFHLLNGGHRLRRPSTILAAGVKAGHKLRLVLSAQS